MKIKLAGLTITTAALLVTAGPALAGGDVIYTGVKDPYAAAVPVPAPAPIPVYDAEYYVRFDTGAAWLANGSLDESGSGMDMQSVEDVETLEFFSAAAGRYVTPSIRAELAVDLFTRGRLDRGEEHFTHTIEVHTPVVSANDIITYDVTRQETIKFEQDLGLLNFYYDFRNGSRFTPYVGAGIGVTYRQLTRTASEVATCAHLHNADDDTRDCANANPQGGSVSEGTETKQAWDLAGALMAGVAIQVTDDIMWDTGYRYLWQNGGLAVDSLTTFGTSRVEIKDLGQHQLRTGVRFNLN